MLLTHWLNFILLKNVLMELNARVCGKCHATSSIEMLNLSRGFFVDFLITEIQDGLGKGCAHVNEILN